MAEIISQPTGVTMLQALVLLYCHGYMRASMSMQVSALQRFHQNFMLFSPLLPGEEVMVVYYARISVQGIGSRQVMRENYMANFLTLPLSRGWGWVASVCALVLCLS